MYHGQCDQQIVAITIKSQTVRLTGPADTYAKQANSRITIMDFFIAPADIINSIMTIWIVAW